VFRAGEPVVGRHVHPIAARFEAPAAGSSADASTITALTRFHERIQVCSIDQDPAKGFSLSIAVSWTQGRQIDDRNQSLQDVVSSRPEAASQVRGLVSEMVDDLGGDAGRSSAARTVARSLFGEAETSASILPSGSS